MKPFPCCIGIHCWRVRAYSLVNPLLGQYSRLHTPAVADRRCTRCDAQSFAIVDVSKGTHDT